MAILPMLRVNIAGHRSNEEEIIKELQNLGVIEIERIDYEDSSPPEWLPEKLAQTNRELSRVKTSINFLKEYVSSKGGIVDIFVPQKFSFTEEERANLIEEFQKNSGYETIELWEKSLEDTKNQIANLIQDKELLSPFQNINLSIKKMKELKEIDVYFCQAKRYEFDSILKEFSELLGDIAVVSQTPLYVFFIIAAHKSAVGEVKGVLSKYTITTYNMERFSETPNREIERIELRLKELEEKRNKVLEDIKTKGEVLIKGLYIMYDDYQNNYLRYENLNKSVHTKSTFFLTGWARGKDKERIKDVLEKRFRNLYIVFSPPSPEEEPPIALENNPLVTPFETVTGIYGMPNSKEFDPTPLIAPFFAIFFALCLTDLGYGIILALLSSYLYKTVLIEKTRKKLLRVLLIGGIITIITGAITGGWFGNAPEVFPFMRFLEPIREKFILFDPIKEPVTFLVLSLALGFIQIMFGLGVKMVLNFRRGLYKEAIFDQLFWMLFLIGIPLAAGTTMIEPLKPFSKHITYFVGIMAIGLVSTQGRHQKSIVLKITSGLGSLYSVIGYLSDVISYSRLLALGLSTGVIATVVNELVKTFSNIPIFGVIIGILIFIGGHLFNLVINAFGAFVHSSRLQFVEFFTKFFEGGGREFKPLRNISIYTIEKEVKG
jgi:V/A-type H+-transporting ATPase subunit I